MTVLPGDRHTVVSIVDEIDVPNLEKLDRRQTGALAGEKPDFGPPLLVAVAPWQEIAGEILIASHASDDGIQRHILQDAPVPAHPAHLLANFLKWEEVCGFSGQGCDHLSQIGAPSRAREIVFR